MLSELVFKFNYICFQLKSAKTGEKTMSYRNQKLLKVIVYVKMLECIELIYNAISRNILIHYLKTKLCFAKLISLLHVRGAKSLISYYRFYNIKFNLIFLVSCALHPIIYIRNVLYDC